MSRIDTMLQSLYTLFVHSPNKHLEFTKLAQILQTKGNKILCNVKTRWINMLNPTSCVMSKYKMLMLKMAKDNMELVIAKTNLSFCVMFPYFWLLLVYCHCLKLLTCIHQILRKEGCLCLQLCGSHKGLPVPFIFIIWWSKYMLCFLCFQRLQGFGCFKIWYSWLVLGSRALDLNDSSVEYLAFHVANHTFLAIYVDPFFGNFNWVTQNVFNNIVEKVKTSKHIKQFQLV